ncbi:MAG: FAD-binding oxidoreductase [Dehalococcoidia bacterium]
MKVKEHYPLYQALANIVGTEHVTDDDFACWATIGDLGIELPPESHLVSPPDIVVRPQSTEQVSRVMRLAQRTSTPVTVAGGKSGVGGGCMPSEGGILLDMLDMNEVLEVDEDSMVVWVQAGCTWSKMLTELERKGLTTGCMGPHGNMSAAVGGSVALNSFGVNTPKYGHVGECVASLEVVLPTGDVIRTGTRSNQAANFTYRYLQGPDMAGLFTGGSGVFGVVTEAALRIYDIPVHTAFSCFAFKSVEAMMEALYRVQRSGYLTDGMGLVGGATQRYFPQVPEAVGVLGLGFDDYDERIARAQKDICDRIALEHGGEDLGQELGEAIVANKWGLASNMNLGFGNSPQMVGPSTTMNALRGGVKAFVEHAERHASDMTVVPHTDLPACQVYVLISNQVMALIGHGGQFTSWDREMRQKWYREDRDFLYRRVKGIGDSLDLVGHRGTEAVVASWNPAYHEFLRALKKAIDPNMILNRGIFNLT